MFPAVLKQRMTGLSIPTLGEICGWADKWDRDHIEADGDEQLPLMKQRRNRVAYYKTIVSSAGSAMLLKGIFFGLLCRCGQLWRSVLPRRFELYWSSSGILVG